MSTPLVITQLLLKKAEVEAQIVSLNDRLTEAKADVIHVVAAVRLFDPTAIDRPATAYHSITKAMKRPELFALCRATLEASAEPLDTRQLTRAVITSEGWDADDRRLRLTIATRVGLMLARYALRGKVEKVGRRDGVTLWRLRDA